MPRPRRLPAHLREVGIGEEGLVRCPPPNRWSIDAGSDAEYGSAMYWRERCAQAEARLRYVQTIIEGDGV